MSRADFLEVLKKNKQESIDREKAYQKRLNEDQEQKKKYYREGVKHDYAAYSEQAGEQARV